MKYMSEIKKIVSIISFSIIISLSISNNALAFGNLFDGGMLMGMADMCSCSGGMTIRVQSYVDSSSHVYLYQMGATQLDMNYNIMGSGNYFLALLQPFAMCLVYEGEDCQDSSQMPEGMFQEIGTSFKFNKDSFASLLKEYPIINSFMGSLVQGLYPQTNN